MNYYHDGDTLCGHIDDAEPDLTQPLVSLSLGRPAVFLIGGTTRDIPPTALLLRSGDVVVLSGSSRRCYHGVPRIFPFKSEQKREKEVKIYGDCAPPVLDIEQEVVQAFDTDDDEFKAEFGEFMHSCRINISIRCTGTTPTE